MNRLYGVVNGICRNNVEKDNELNKKIYARNIPSQALKPNFDLRPSATKYTMYPTNTNNRHINVSMNQYQPYNNQEIFNPGSDRAPSEGYFSNIDKESILRNQIHPLQKADQAAYVPSTNSDLYKTIIKSKIEPQTHPLLFQQQQFASFNPNVNNLGKFAFNNSTRSQLKDKVSLQKCEK